MKTLSQRQAIGSMTSSAYKGKAAKVLGVL